MIVKYNYETVYSQATHGILPDDVIRNFAPPKFRKVNQPEIGKVK